MSWIVQRRLMDTEAIREVNDIDSDDYNDLLIIEKKIKEMRGQDFITNLEFKILTLIQSGYLFGDIETIIDVGRDTVSKIFKNVCERIAYSLGGEFTDEGFIKEVADRHRLTEEDTTILEEFMESNLRHKILRRPLGTKK